MKIEVSAGSGMLAALLLACGEVGRHCAYLHSEPAGMLWRWRRRRGIAAAIGRVEQHGGGAPAIRPVCDLIERRAGRLERERQAATKNADAALWWFAEARP